MRHEGTHLIDALADSGSPNTTVGKTVRMLQQAFGAQQTAENPKF